MMAAQTASPDTEGRDLSRLLRYVPAVAPVPEGYALYLSITKELQWNPVIAGVSALIVAATGFFSIALANQMSEFNSGLFMDEKKQNFKAPTWKPVVVAVIWFVCVVIITVFLDVYPALKAWTPVALVGIGTFCASWITSLHYEHASRRKILDKTRTRKKQEHADTKQAKAKARQKEQAEESKKASQMQARRQEEAKVRQAIAASGKLESLRNTGKVQIESLLLDWWNQPRIGDEKLAKKYAVSRQAIQERRAALVGLGVISYSRSEGVKIVGIELGLA